MIGQAGASASSSPHAGAQRRVIGSFDNYSDAERVVDYLSDHRFPVEHVAIVGTDVQYVEQVTGRMTYGGAALRGAGSGAVTGFLFGWIFGLFDWIHPVLGALTLALYGLVFGAIAGALVGLLIHALQGGRRDFAAVSGMLPTRFEVLVDAEVADEALRVLSRREGASAAR
jgi:hypothetical protein